MSIALYIPIYSGASQTEQRTHWEQVFSLLLTYMAYLWGMSLRAAPSLLVWNESSLQLKRIGLEWSCEGSAYGRSFCSPFHNEARWHSASAWPDQCLTPVHKSNLQLISSPFDLYWPLTLHDNLSCYFCGFHGPCSLQSWPPCPKLGTSSAHGPYNGKILHIIVHNCNYDTKYQPTYNDTAMSKSICYGYVG